MKETPTPRKDLSQRRPKVSPSTTSSSASDNSNNSRKVAKKNLNVVFSSLSEDLLDDSVTQSFNFSPISEAFSGTNNVNHNEESSESFEHLIAEDEVITSPDSSALSMITTVNEDSLINTCSRGKVFKSNSNVEVEVVSNLLQQARDEVSSSSDVSPGSKKLLDSLVGVTVKEFGALPDEKESPTVMKKTRFLVFSSAVWFSLMLILIISRCLCGVTSSFNLPPT